MEEKGQLLKVDAMGRVRVTRERREVLLAEYDRSSMSGAAFAQWAGIKYSTLMWWLRERARNGQPATAKVAGAREMMGGGGGGGEPGGWRPVGW